MAAKFHIYKDKKGEFRWNPGKVLVLKGEGYSTVRTLLLHIRR